MCLKTEEHAADMSRSRSHLFWEPAVSFHKGHGMKINLIALKKKACLSSFTKADRINDFY